MASGAPTRRIDARQTPAACRWSRLEGDVHLYAPLDNRTWRADGLRRPRVAAFFALCTRWADEDQVRAWAASLLDLAADAACDLVRSMLGEGLLVREGDPRAAYFDAGRHWVEQGWAAPLSYHAHTNLLEKFDYARREGRVADVEMMRGYVEDGPQPPLYKVYDDAPTVALPKADGRGTLPFPAGYTSTVDYAQARPVDRTELGRFLHLAFGQTGWRRMAVTGQHLTKTCPSGGARHPTEVYPVVLEVEGVAPGAYHYNVRDHTLELLRPGDHTAFLMRHVFYRGSSTPWPRPAVAFLLTTVFERSQFRYRDARSYRVMHFDIGHLTQNARVLARALCRRARPDYTLEEREVDAFLGIDGVLEASMAHLSLT
ncbi:MAG: SagB/ThcOx family dehydrogenase [Myxococcota bacterium]